jgi:hypothetical protein
MKIHLVHNKAGKILAAVRLGTESDGGPRPMAGKNEQELVLEVPPEHSSMSFLEICRKLQVDSKTKKFVVPRKPPSKKRK